MLCEKYQPFDYLSVLRCFRPISPALVTTGMYPIPRRQIIIGEIAVSGGNR